MSTSKKKRNSWTQSDLEEAVTAVRTGGLSSYKAAETYKIPRRTLRDYIKSGKSKLELGRKSILTKEREQDFVKRIIRFADLGIPLTGKMIRKQVFVFCEKYDIPNNFNKQSRLAGRDWLKLFLKRNHVVAKRKAQFLNQARGQKLNKSIVTHHFQQVKKLHDELEIHYNPERLYNMDEKGCRLTMHKQPTVIAQKGTKRVHIQASEHGENVTIVGCANAVGNPIPPMIIFKGVRRKPEFETNLPPGTTVKMAPKGSMTSELFIDFLKHFAKHKTAGNSLLIFDGAKCHLDYRIAEEADLLGITLYCLPSNTTHELQPLDKACYKPFESYWDQEVMQHLYETHAQKLTRPQFNKILSKIWSNCMSHANITSGFRATGLYPFNPHILPESAFAPSILTEQQIPQNEVTTEDRISSPIVVNSEELQRLLNVHPSTPEVTPSRSLVKSTKKLVCYSSSSDDYNDEQDASDVIKIMRLTADVTPPRSVVEGPSISGLQPVKSLVGSFTDTHKSEDSSKGNNVRQVIHYAPGITPQRSLDVVPPTSGLQPRTRFECSSTDDSENSSDSEDVSKMMTRFITRPILPSLRIYSSGSDTETENDADDVPLAELSGKSQFHTFMPTPNYAITKKRPRRKALNYRGQKITKDLFNDTKETKKKGNVKIKTANSNKRSDTKAINRKGDAKTKTTKITKTDDMKETTKKGDGKTETENRKKKELTDKNKKEKNNETKTQKNKTKTSKSKGKENKSADDWYCNACYENRIADMRPCGICQKWYHEECVGLTRNDVDIFKCPGGCD